MKYVFIIALIVLSLAAIGVHWFDPPPVEDGKLVLHYSSVDFWAKHEQVALFNKLNPKFLVRIDTGNTDPDKTILQSLAGVGPDFFNAYSAANARAFVDAGIAWDLTDELNAAGINVREQVWPSTLNLIIHHDRVYGFPYAAHADALYFNKVLFDRAHIPYPQGVLTQAQFLALAQQLTIRTPGSDRVEQYGFVFSWELVWQHFLLQWGARVFNETGTRCELDSPAAIAAIQFLHDLVYKYHVAPSPEQEAGMATSGGWGSGSITWFGAGRAAMSLGGRFYLVAFRHKEEYPNFRPGVVEYQLGPHRIYRGYGGSVMINKQSPHRREALEYLKFMASQPFNEMVNDQADGLAPVKQFSDTPVFRLNPKYPDEDFNTVWRAVLERSVPDQLSPFVDGAILDLIISRQLGLVRANAKPVADALRTAAKELNEEIQRNIAETPALRAEYQRLEAMKP